MNLSVFFFVAFIFGVNSQLNLPGTCNFNNFNFVRNLNATILGNWYQIERINNNVEQGQCSRFEVVRTIGVTVSNIEVLNRVVRIRNGTVQYEILNGTPTGTFQMLFSDGIYNSVILRTDYTNYAVLYSCRNGVSPNTKLVWAWKLSKRTSLTNQQTREINEAVDTNPDLRNARWYGVAHTRQACSSSATLYLSPLLMLTLFTSYAKNIFI